ncbi:hypothetical protein [Gordonia alkanivorans]|uniref:hypothetical protein n=1 Tax=Gordonia alkanivorans TaxID=84096 RepID=UPI00244B7D08|nr:hypothetical protein [Gordonia alkanivorans]MDH3047257.1 hypothetical protein [Gordonia alkanivorans]
MSHDKDIDAADWVDQDLLTRDEAAERLDNEIVVARTRLTALRSENGDTASITLVERRLSAMENLRTRLTDDKSV